MNAARSCTRDTSARSSRALTGLVLLTVVAPAFAHEAGTVHDHAMGPAGVILLAVVAGGFALAAWLRRGGGPRLAPRPVRAVRERRRDPR